MEIFFEDPDDMPVGREQVKIREFNAEPYPDGRRIRIYLEVSPFQFKPDAEIALVNAIGEIVASASVIETVNPKMDMTLHAPVEIRGGEYSLHAVVQYRIELPLEHPDQEDQPREFEVIVVDRREIAIVLP
jgi:hypothetical protein